MRSPDVAQSCRSEVEARLAVGELHPKRVQRRSLAQDPFERVVGGSRASICREKRSNLASRRRSALVTRSAALFIRPARRPSTISRSLLSASFLFFSLLISFIILLSSLTFFSFSFLYFFLFKLTFQLFLRASGRYSAALSIRPRQSSYIMNGRHRGHDRPGGAGKLISHTFPPYLLLIFP